MALSIFFHIFALRIKLLLAMNEKWKTITFATRYEVSNLGRVRNKNTKKVLSIQGKNRNRYPTVFLVVDRSIFEHEQYSVSQLVYNHWCISEGERPSYYQQNGYKVKGNRIGHKDGDIYNNIAMNLYRY